MALSVCLYVLAMLKAGDTEREHSETPVCRWWWW